MSRPFSIETGTVLSEKGTVPFFCAAGRKGELQNLANKVELNNW